MNCANKGQNLPLERVAVVILGGGEGTRLKPLTHSRCKPAVSFGGRYTLIDVPISHSLTSGLSNIFVIGQYMADSLKTHLEETYHHQGISEDKIKFLTPEGDLKYEGTADAVRKNLDRFARLDADYFLILSGDQLYNINFQKMLDFALDTQAGMVIAAQPVNACDATRMGLLQIEQGGSKLVDFHEKPKEKAILDRFYTDNQTLEQLGYDGNRGKNYLGSMGIYLFKKEVLFNLLKEDPREDFGKHLIGTQMAKGDVHTFLYDGYWEDIGTINSYYHANLALTLGCNHPDPRFDCYAEGNHIITKRYHLPGTRISDCRTDRALLCEGTIVNAQEVTNSIIGIRGVIGQGSVVRDSIILGNEYYEHLTEKNPGIGQDCHLQKVIIDENVTIGDNVRLLNYHGHHEYSSPDGRVIVRDGIMVIPRGTHIPNNYTF